MEKTKILNRNLKLYTIVKMVGPLVMWSTLMTIFYKERGLSYADIALIQTIGSAFSMLIDIPTGMLADRLGDKFFMVLCPIFCIIACILNIFAYGFTMFLLAEFAFGTGFACMSGAGSSFFYKNLREMGRLDEYRTIVSNLDKRAVPIRMFSRFIAPILYSFMSISVFIISAIIYAIMLICYLQFDESQFTKVISEKVKEEGVKLKEKFFKLIIRYKSFILLSVLSLIFFTLISNFGQYFPNQIEEMGFNIAFLGVLYTIRSAGGYFSNMIAPRIKEKDTWKCMFLFPSIFALFLIVLYFSYNIYTTLFIFFAADFVITPFDTLLAEKIHQSVDDKHRTTMLSISHQFDNFSTFLFDPLIGFSLDRLGFKLTYFYLGGIFLVVITMIGIYFFKIRIYKKRGS